MMVVNLDAIGRTAFTAPATRCAGAGPPVRGLLSWLRQRWRRFGFALQGSFSLGGTVLYKLPFFLRYMGDRRRCGHPGLHYGSRIHAPRIPLVTGTPPSACPTHRRRSNRRWCCSWDEPPRARGRRRRRQRRRHERSAWRDAKYSPGRRHGCAARAQRADSAACDRAAGACALAASVTAATPNSSPR